MNEAAEYVIKAETKLGNVLRLRGGFASREDAEDHPVKLSLWNRVWVEKLPLLDKSTPSLAAFPWDWATANAPDRNGHFHAYLVDANGKKVAAVWGSPAERKDLCEYIVKACNGRRDDA